jgi:hypothetical protein
MFDAVLFGHSCLMGGLDLGICLRVTIDFDGGMVGLRHRLSGFDSSCAEIDLVTFWTRTGCFSGVQVADFISGVGEEDPSGCSDGLSQISIELGSVGIWFVAIASLCCVLVSDFEAFLSVGGRVIVPSWES